MPNPTKKKKKTSPRKKRTSGDASLSVSERLSLNDLLSGLEQSDSLPKRELAKLVRQDPELLKKLEARGGKGPLKTLLASSDTNKFKEIIDALEPHIPSKSRDSLVQMLGQQRGLDKLEEAIASFRTAQVNYSSGTPEYADSLKQYTQKAKAAVEEMKRHGFPATKANWEHLRFSAKYKVGRKTMDEIKSLEKAQGFLKRLTHDIDPMTGASVRSAAKTRSLAKKTGGMLALAALAIDQISAISRGEPSFLWSTAKRLTGNSDEAVRARAEAAEQKLTEERERKLSASSDPSTLFSGQNSDYAQLYMQALDRSTAMSNRIDDMEADTRTLQALPEMMQQQRNRWAKYELPLAMAQGAEIYDQLSEQDRVKQQEQIDRVMALIPVE